MLARIDAAAARASAAEPAGKPFSRNAWIVRTVERELAAVGLAAPEPTSKPPTPKRGAPKTLYVVNARKVGSQWAWHAPGGWWDAIPAGMEPFKMNVAPAATECIARALGHRNFDIHVEWS
jgi:hypothetical protein